MGLRIPPINPLVAEQIAEFPGFRRAVERPAAEPGAARPADRAAELRAAVAEAARAVILARTAERALDEMDARINDIRDVVAEAGSRAFLGDTDLITLQQQIGRNVVRLRIIVETTRFFGVTVLDGSVRNEAFNLGRGTVTIITIPNLAVEELGRGVPNQAGITNLAQINIAQFPPGVRLPRGLADAFLVSDAALADIGRVRGEVDAFRTEVFTSMFRALRAERRALGLAEAGSREIDFSLAPPRLALSELLRQADIVARQLDASAPGTLLNLLI